jgi:TonB family protein
MAAGAQAQGWDRPSRRAIPRYRVQAMVDVTVLRSGIPDTLPGRSINLSERGIAAILSGELTPGEAVGLEVRLPLIATPLRTRALVRHYDRLRCGMEFVGLSSDQKASIRDWAGLAKAPSESERISTPQDVDAGESSRNDASVRDMPAPGSSETDPPSTPRRKRRRALWTLLLILAAGLSVVFWWRWNRGWEELESGLLSRSAADADRRVHVPAEVMEKLLLHRVDPEYPAAARSGELQGVIVLNVVIGTDGSVVQIRPLNGPEVLSHAAVEALRWWKFQPYRVSGQAVEVETTVAVEFKSPGRG